MRIRSCPPVHTPVSFQIPPATSLHILFCFSLKYHCSFPSGLWYTEPNRLYRYQLLQADFYLSGPYLGFLPPLCMQAPSMAGGPHSYHLTWGICEIWLLPSKRIEMKCGNPMMCKGGDLGLPRMTSLERYLPPDQEEVNVQIIQRKNHHRLLPLNPLRLCLHCSHRCNFCMCWHIQAGLTSLIR